ncbi:MAG TPA: methionyl-tRNA formyltransferase [Candidatus Marinimicrobia bacterium]|nr:methionyl-tRNA formyltransferase [Candidatus Neomarinimicrobiota bacterium]
MKVIFMGTPGFAVPSLKAIAKSRHEIMLVVTGEDKPAGRGRSLRESPVKTLARELNLPILQPPTLKSAEFIEQLTQYNADIIVVVAFRILPGEVIDITPNGAINLHASLLPKYRGAAPINWALINGDTQTGATVFQIRTRVDTGDILTREKVDISEQDTFGILYDKLSWLGAKILVQTLDKLETGELQPIPQSHDLATKAPKIYPELGAIDWTKDARAIKWLIHGLSPAPGAYTFYKKKRIKILTAEYSMNSLSDIPGEIVTRNKKQFGIQTGKGVLYPLELQAEGRKALAVADFLKGFQTEIGEKFSS